MKIIQLSFSDINGGAFRATYRIHNSLLKPFVLLNNLLIELMAQLMLRLPQQ